MHALRRVRAGVPDGCHSHSGPPGPGQRTLSLSYASCIQCRACVDACPEEAVSGGRDVEVAAFSREQLQQTASFDVDAATAHARSVRWRCRPGPSLDESAAALRDRIHGRLGRSLHVRQVDAGSCNGCELEIAATDQSAVRSRALRHALRRQPAARGRAAGDRPRHAQHGDRAATNLRGHARAARRRRRRRVRLQRRDLWRGRVCGAGRRRPRACRWTCTFPAVRRGRRRS